MTISFLKFCLYSDTQVNLNYQKCEFYRGLLKDTCSVASEVN